MSNHPDPTIRFTDDIQVSVDLSLPDLAGDDVNFTVSGLVADLTVSNTHTGNGAVTTCSTESVDVNFGTNTTGTHSVNADALADGQLLNLTGTDEATVTLMLVDLSAATYAGNLVVTATHGTNIITTGDGNDTITGGASADLLTGGGGMDKFLFETTQALNGIDNTADFNTVVDDMMSFNFGEGTNLSQTDLRGDGTALQLGTGSISLDANTGFVIYTGSVADAATAKAVAEGFVGEAAEDIIYLLTSTDSTSPETATLYLVSYAAENDATLASLATFSNLQINALDSNNFNQFAFFS